MLYHQWEYSVKAPDAAVIMPDGCRDVIMATAHDVEDSMWITGLDDQPRLVTLYAGISLTGFRLEPGTTINPEALSSKEIMNPVDLQDWIESEVQKDCEVMDLIEALTLPRATIAKVARQNGTTPRTLQRQFQRKSLPTPDFWRMLGRARRAIQALPCLMPLAEIAYAYGYSDQAHMTREFVRWFGLPPADLRKRPESIAEICQPGLGNWFDDSPSKLGNLF